MPLPLISVPFLICGLISTLLAWYAWRYRSTSGARAFVYFTLAVAIYCAGYAMELASPNLQTALFWNNVQYIGILTFPTLYLIFVIHYLSHGAWLSPTRLALLFTPPAVLFLIKLFDGSLHLVYASAEMGFTNSFFLLSFTRGPLYPYLGAYHLMMVSIANYLLLQKWRYSTNLYRIQTTLMLVSAVIVYALFVIYILGIPPLPILAGLDFIPLAYAIWTVGISLAIFRYRLFDLAPIAREALIERLTDGVVVLDYQTRVVDANSQALKIQGWTQTPFGQPAREALASWLTPGFESTSELPLRIEVTQALEGAALVYEVTIVALRVKGGEKIGYLIGFHDITRRKAIEAQLKELSLSDELTGLTNRRGFNLLANQVLTMATRMQLDASLFYIDIDDLKYINDTLGHATGDLAIKDVADFLKSSFRSSDVVTHLSGDEFVILAIQSRESSATMMRKRLQEDIKSHYLLGRSFQLNFSTGVAQYSWKQPKSLDDLMAEADKAMYAAKQAKKGYIAGSEGWVTAVK